jgi:DNA-binding beta-propeller fold protein YncE
MVSSTKIRRFHAMLLLVFFIMTGASAAEMHTGKSTTAATVLLTGLDDARSVRISTLGNLFIVETGRHRILITDRDGVRVDSVGRLGNGDYQFDHPVAIDPTNELKIYVADRNNRRIQVFDRRLQYLSTLQMPQRAGLPSRYLPARLVVDPSGNIFFFDEDRHVVYRFDSHGQYELDFELFGEDGRIIPVAMAMLDDELWVAGERGQLLHRFTSHGSYLGFVYAPEPVRALRASGGSLWMLGTEHVLQMDGGGQAVRSQGLPGVPGSVTGSRRQNRRQAAANGTWHTFDIRDNTIYLLNKGMLIRMTLTE